MREIKEYQIGDKIWYANVGTQLVTEECPVCFNKRVVTVILGNGDHVETICDYCGKGWEKARGYVEYYRYVAEPVQIEIIGKDVSESSEGRKIRYTAHRFHIDNDFIYDTEEEATALAKEEQENHEARETATRKARKENNYKSYAWHVGYYRKEAKSYREKAEWYERRAVLAKKASPKT